MTSFGRHLQNNHKGVFILLKIAIFKGSEIEIKTKKNNKDFLHCVVFLNDKFL